MADVDHFNKVPSPSPDRDPEPEFDPELDFEGEPEAEAKTSVETETENDENEKEADSPNEQNENSARTPSPALRRTSSLGLKDNAWIAEKPDESVTPVPEVQPPKILRAVSASKNDGPKTGNSKPLKGIAKVFAQVSAKVLALMPLVDKAGVFVSTYYDYLEAYVAVVLLLFGSYFINTTKTFETLLRLGFLPIFANLFMRVKKVRACPALPLHQKWWCQCCFVVRDGVG